MTALLYISYSSGLSENDKLIIDRQVSRNLETVFIIVTVFGSVFWFSNLEPAKAIGLSMPSPPIVKIQQNYNSPSEMKVAPTVNPKSDKITFIKYRELPVCLFMMDEKFLKASETRKLVNKIRGGNFIEAATALVVILLMWQILGVGIDSYGFQIPIVGPNGAPHRPGNGGIQGEITRPKHKGRITVRMPESTQCSAHQAQIDGFVKNGRVDLRDCYNEVNRRASEIGCTDFQCSFDRFKELATENGKVSVGSAREAITALQGEMHGYYSNTAHENYGKGILGLDFRVTGQGEFKHITHVEIKNPVGSDIQQATCEGYSDIVEQGNRIGAKISSQQTKWSNATFRDTLRHLNPNAVFPQTSANTLGLVDEFDVPISEKIIVQDAVKNNCTNVTFINNETNI